MSVDMTSWLQTTSGRKTSINVSVMRTFAEFLPVFWRQKAELRKKRLENRGGSKGSVSSFDIYDLGSKAFEALNEDGLVTIIEFFLRNYEYMSRQKDDNGFLVDVRDFEFKMPRLTDSNSNQELSFVSVNLVSDDVPKGLKALAAAIFSKMDTIVHSYPNGDQWRNWENQTQREVAEDIENQFRNMIMQWGLSVDTIPISQRRVTSSDTSQISIAITELIKEMLSVAAFRVLHYGVSVETDSRSKDGTVVEKDENINPSTVDVKSLEELENLPFNDVLNYSRERLKELVGVLKEFENLVGLNEPGGVKEKVLEFVKSLVRRPAILFAATSHIAFLGPPGTGKTSVATLLGKVLKTLGLLTNPAGVQVVDRETLVAPFEGQTALRAHRFLVEMCYDNVAFLDEAYQLVHSTRDDAGMEALGALFTFMNNYPEFVAIFAGYEKELYNSIFKVQRGIPRRLGYVFRFTGYSAEELTLIAMKRLEEARSEEKRLIDGWEEGVEELIQQVMEETMGEQGKDFASKLVAFEVGRAKGNALIRAPGENDEELTGRYIDLGREIMDQDQGQAYIERLYSDALVFGNYAGDVNQFIAQLTRRTLQRKTTGSVVVSRSDVAETYESFAIEKKTRLDLQVLAMKNN